MKTIITSLLLLVAQFAFSQSRSASWFQKEIGNLVMCKIDYEKYRSFAESDPDRYEEKRDSSYQEYLSQIDKIKRNAEQFLKYIDTAANNPELVKKTLPYIHINTTLPFDPNAYFISRHDLLSVIKYSLLERDDAMLPERLDDIPIAIKRDRYKPFKPQSIEDITKDRIKTENN